MRMRIQLFFGVIMLLLSLATKGQVELQKIAPLSPNASSIVKYGEVPVGHFTGVPSLSLPVYTIQSTELVLPLSLSYHGSGNKVEDVASWVGLGWSLGTLPSISRSIRSLPDEEYVGVVTPYQGLTLSDITSIMLNGTLETNQYYWDLYCQIFNGQIDTEADIYFFSLPSKSGRFYWNHKTSKYQTDPWSNLKITGGAFEGFEIVDEDGTIYKFWDIETSQSLGISSGPVRRTSWHVTKMYNANKTDSLSFSYSQETQVTKTINPKVREVFGGCTDNSLNLSTTYLSSKVLNQISYSGGSVVFNRLGTQREDLTGGYVLNEIIAYNSKQQLVKKVKLDFSYLTATAYDPLCSSISSSTQEQKRLLLRHVKEYGTGNSALTHSLYYDTTTTSPCRVSSAQDFWGYYNGKVSNQDLVPTSPIQLGSTPTLVKGADRLVNPAYSQFGVLKKIVYPTGGYSEFTYENNEVYNNNLPGHYLYNSAYVSGEGSTNTNTYIDTFQINNPSDLYLNRYIGGAFVDIDFGYLGCTIGPGGNTCAQLYLRGLDPSNNSINTSVTSVSEGFHLPNGSYEMKAVFNQNPPLWEDFYYVISWNSLDTTKINRYAGGLRIKQVVSNDQFGNQLTKFYQYTNTLSSDTSSGQIFGPANLIQYQDWYCGSNNYSYRILATGNATTVSHSGTYAGYQTVYEKTDSSLTQGLTELKFTFAQDAYYAMPPYPPTENYSEFRGQPIEITRFKKEDSQLIPVSKTINEYSAIAFETDTVVNLFFSKQSDATCQFEQPGSEQLSWQMSYYNTPLLSKILNTTEISYNPTDITKQLQTVTTYQYSPVHYLLKETQVTSSDNKVLKTKTYYPKDIATTGDAETARLELINRNVFTTPLKVEKFVETTKTEEIVFNYKKSGTYNIVKPNEIFQGIKGSTPESRIKFLKYTDNGQLLEQQKTNDVLQSYIWGYGNKYPVAQIVGKSYDDAVSQSGINLTIVNNPSTEADLITELNKLRTLTGAFVTTYTYKPEIGLSTQTDPRGRTTYYYYDNFNRLSSVRDHDNKLLKQICYNYAGQAENCVDCVNTTANWQNTDEYSCQKNGSNENTGYQLRKQVDINPCSLTYGGVQWVASSYNTSACPLPVQTVYAKVFYDNLDFTGLGYVADIKIKFFSNAACTVPISVSNMAIYFRELYEYYDHNTSSSSYYQYDLSSVANGYEYVIGYSQYIQYYGWDYDEYWDYILLPNSNYVIQ